MKILFLTIYRIDDISEKGIYTDLIRKFRDEGHSVFIATPFERRYKQKTSKIERDNVTILTIKTLNFQKTSILEKGISTMLIGFQFLRAIKKLCPELRFDLVLYSTPPITFAKVVSYFKRANGGKTYLLLKDIFPQNAVDLGMMRHGSLLHKYFRKKEQQLYAISDHIGCMSPANVGFLLEHNKELDPKKIEVNPNTIQPKDSILTTEQKVLIRQKYHIPEDTTVFIYGGNLGKPQGIPFLIEVINSQKNKAGVFFVVTGNGSEFPFLNSWYSDNQPINALLISVLPKHEYDMLLQSCDVGLIFLDRRFTIPNFPSRLLSYLEYKLPVIAATDKYTDIGKIMVENGFGLWSEAGRLEDVNHNINKLLHNPELVKEMGQAGHNYLLKNYTVNMSYNTIISHFQDV